MTYSHATVHGTTIGSKRLNVRVRYVYVCFPRAYCHQAKYSLQVYVLHIPYFKLFDHLMNIMATPSLNTLNINFTQTISIS